MDAEPKPPWKGSRRVLNGQLSPTPAVVAGAIEYPVTAAAYRKLSTPDSTELPVKGE